MSQSQSQTKQVVRRLERSGAADFDEQRWPVNLVLLILAACVAGIIIGNSNFETPRLLENGWFHLGILVMIVGVLAGGMIWLEGRVQRRLQLAVFFSLLVHLWLCLLTYHVYMRIAAERDMDAMRTVDEPQPVTLPDYHWQDDLEEVAGDELLETPVATDTPESDLTPVERSASEPLPLAERPPAEPIPNPREPTPAEVERAEVAAPHRAESLAGETVSRQELRVDRAAEQIPTPLVEPAAEPAPALEARTAEPERQAAAVAPQATAPQAPDSLLPLPSQSAAARQQTSLEPEAAAPAARLPSRAVSPPADLPDVEIDEPRLARAQPSTPETLEPAEAQAERRQTAASSPVPVEPADDAVVRTPSPANLSQRRASQADRPQIERPDVGRPATSSRAPADGLEVAQIEIPAVAPNSSEAGIAGSSAAGGLDAPQLDAQRQTGDPAAGSTSTAPSRPGEPSAPQSAAGAEPSARRASDGGSQPELTGVAGADRVPLGRRAPPAVPRGGADVPAPEASAPEAAPSASVAGEALEAPEGVAAPRRRPAGLPVPIAAPPGPGGLSSDPAPDVGVPGRRARPESELVHTSPGRVILERSGGRRAADVRVQDTAVAGLRQRDRQNRQELARRRGGSEASERAVELGLDFLARHQQPDGNWSLQFDRQAQGYENAGSGSMQSDTAATGMALLAFLGAGYTHTDGKYRLVVERGLEYLLANQRPDGDLFKPEDERSNQNVWLYSHGMAAIALCEAYGMTRDPALAERAQRALDFIVAAQNPVEGGWRYSPGRGSDTSVSGWQLMALKSGELAGLSVPAESYRRVEGWLDHAQAGDNPGLYAYRPRSPLPHQNQPSRVMTAEALLMRQYLGWNRDHPYMIAGAEHLGGNLPEWGTPEGRERDAYYWYYATQVMFQMGGEPWEQWNERLRAMLVEAQVGSGPLAGSWDPDLPVPDRWGREAGRIYVTAMHLLMLEVYYRHLPLYRTLEE